MSDREDIITSKPKLGDNVLVTCIQICKTRGCGKPVFVDHVCPNTDRVYYSCPEHGRRNRQQMAFMPMLGMVEFRKVGK